MHQVGWLVTIWLVIGGGLGAKRRNNFVNPEKIWSRGDGTISANGTEVIVGTRVTRKLPSPKLLPRKIEITQQQKDEIAQMKKMRDEDGPNLFEAFMSKRKGPAQPEPEPEAEPEPEPEAEESENEGSQFGGMSDNSPISSSNDSLGSEPMDEPAAQPEAGPEATDASGKDPSKKQVFGRKKQAINSIKQEMQMLKYKYPHLYTPNQPVGVHSIP